MEFWKTGSQRASSQVVHELFCEDIHELWERKGCAETLRERYWQEIEESFDWDMIHQELDSEKEDYLMYGYEEEPRYCIFAATVFGLNPSGKCWTFWAASNMTMREMVRDTIYNEVLEEVVESHGLWMENGLGDLCDVFFCKVVESAEQ